MLISKYSKEGNVRVESNEGFEISVLKESKKQKVLKQTTGSCAVKAPGGSRR